MIPIAHYRGAFKWQCGRVPANCALGQKTKFLVGDNRRSGVDDIRWECLAEAQEQRPAGLSLTLEAHCEGTTIAASLSRAMECRKAWLDSRQVVHEAEDWKPCEPKSVANEEIALRVDDSTLRATTSTQGKATFDLSEVKPNEKLVSKPKADLMVFGNIAHMAVASVDLSRCEVFPVWQQKLKLAADAKRLEIDSQRREHAIRCLEIAENAIASIANGKTWTRERMDSYVEAVERLEVVQRSLYELSPLDVARSQRVRDKLESLLPSLKKQVAAEAAERARQAAERERREREWRNSPEGRKEAIRVGEEERRQREVLREREERELQRAQAQYRCEKLCDSAASTCEFACPRGEYNVNQSCRGMCYAQKQSCAAGCQR